MSSFATYNIDFTRETMLVTPMQMDAVLKSPQHQIGNGHTFTVGEFGTLSAIFNLLHLK